ncbi:aliphatic sulfonate ABC transporter substrate-binding protein [Paenibacillus darwinianus]|uniref:Aliphatic sulfonate ABC transporter substrate-binding protein n=1 Tax=Paenibacillus darwinianus TaxID=1380763 RepID=A0A9W5S0H7_9BACL|nr:ABC transporter substrate-binding protein [Paenibacillus darwinianus]EXX86321.1 aliphatic sulfonate ABC transporter substrate-binding protein [Paenibacillus darwinianus]EXX86423.1 aliphatic sulfonate ABC transporter substrate-binding protein [Paenibacillus darwinianus]EXX88548.1 aliphatic sulfonate ABC transporter substrate-binding protein [Paenibacillus darwinianus]
MEKAGRKMLALLTMLVLAFTIVACGGGAKETSGAGSGEPITIALSPWPGWYMWYLAEEKGFFEKRGVKVKLEFFPVYSDSLQALSTGKVDANSQTLSDTLAPASRGIGLKAVLVNDNSFGGDAIVSKTDINSIQDLKGKTVATELGTVDHLLLLTALDRNGMKESDINYVNMTVNDAGPAFISGNIDAAVLWEPFQTKAVKEGNGKVLFSSKDTPGLIPDLLVFRESVVKERPEDVQKIVDAWFDALDYFQANPEESIKLLAGKAETTPDDFKLGLDSIKLFTPEDNVKAFEKGDDYTSLAYTGAQTAKFLKNLDMIGDIKDIEALLDPQFVIKSAGR